MLLASLAGSSALSADGNLTYTRAHLAWHCLEDTVPGLLWLCESPQIAPNRASNDVALARCSITSVRRDITRV